MKTGVGLLPHQRPTVANQRRLYDHHIVGSATEFVRVRLVVVCCEVVCVFPVATHQQVVF